MTTVSKMTIALFGATGPTGREVLCQALERGHSIQALARTPAKLELKHAQLSVIQGDVLDAKAVERVVQGSDAVIVTLGGKPKDKLRALGAGTKNIIASMKAYGQKRLIVVTSLGVGDSKGKAGFFFERIIVPLFLKAEFADKLAQEIVVQKSGLEFVIARPGSLRNDAAKGTYEAARKLEAGSSARITRTDVAHFCLEQLQQTTWLGQAVSLSN
jgi:nucleoside-diphosphate-sugar epimerase